MGPRFADGGGSVDRVEHIVEQLARVSDPLQLLGGIFAFAPMAFQIFDAKGYAVLHNDAHTELFGSSPPPEYNLFEDDILAERGLLPSFERALQGERVLIPTTWYDARELRSVQVTGGRRVAVEATVFPIFDAPGQVAWLALFFRDRTAETLAAEALQRERDVFEAVIRQSGDGVILADRAGVLTLFNAEAERQHGVSFQAVGTSDWADTYGLIDEHGAPLPRDQTPLYRALLGERVRDAQWRVRRPDGTVRTLSGTASPLRDRAGVIAGAVLTTRDVTEREGLERELLGRQLQVQRLMDANIFGFIIGRMDGRITESNDAFLDMLGYTRADLEAGVVRWDVITPPEFAQVSAHVVAQLRETGRAAPIEKEYLHRDGSRVPVLIASSRVEALDQNLTLVIDLRERKRAEEDRLALASRVAHADRLAAIGQMAAGVAHEINNPAAIVAGQLELLRRRRSTIGEERRDEMLGVCLDAIYRIGRITRGLLTFGRLEAEQREILDVRAVVELATTLVGSEVRARGALDVEVDALPNVRGDANRLAQVLTNLLLNATQALPSGAPGNRVRLHASADEEHVRIVVEDNGDGVPEAVRKRLFEAFFTTKPPGSGTGLGLALSLEIARQHGGDLRYVETARGARFELILPVATALPAEVRPAPARGLRILIVDDEIPILDALAGLLGAAHEVARAASGPEALAVLERDRAFDVVLCDIAMPEMSGIELWMRAGEQYPDVAERFVFASGGAYDPTIRAFLAEHQIDVVPKPFRFDELERALRAGAARRPA